MYHWLIQAQVFLRSASKRAIYLVGLAVLLLAACQPIRPVEELATVSPTAAMQESATVSSTETMEESAAVSSTVMVTETEDLGQFLVDAQGMTLYLFLRDTPGVTNCYDQCAERWPPLLTEGEATAGPGLDAALMGTTERTDGTTQVTYNGWPLYYWYEDMAVGDTAGQDVGEVWYVISPAGEIIGAPTIKMGKNDALGDFLVDGKGMTLYLFLKDTPGVSNCYDECADKWPPLLADGDATLGKDVDAALMGTTERTDGTTQLTYNGWPLYYYAEDVALGDTTGQGRGDAWYVVSASGEMVQ